MSSDRLCVVWKKGRGGRRYAVIRIKLGSVKEEGKGGRRRNEKEGKRERWSTNVEEKGGKGERGSMRREVRDYTTLN